MMRKIEFERYLIDLSNNIVNNYQDFDSIDSLYLSLKEEYKNLSIELYNANEKEDIIYLTSLISKFQLLASQIEIKKLKLRKNEESNKILNIKYAREIIQELFKNPGLSHKQLAEALNVDKTLLTECLNKMYSKDIIDKNEVSSKSVYYLTDFGRFVYDKIDSNSK